MNKASKVFTRLLVVCLTSSLVAPQVFAAPPHGGGGGGGGGGGSSSSAPSHSSAPSYSAPSYSAPSYSAPARSEPARSAPSYSAPAPSYSAPARSEATRSAPTYSAPAPSYSAPARSSEPARSAPVASAPTRSEPVRAEPVRAAPVVSAPARSSEPARSAPVASAPARSTTPARPTTPAQGTHPSLPSGSVTAQPKQPVARQPVASAPSRSTAAPTKSAPVKAEPAKGTTAATPTKSAPVKSEPVKAAPVKGSEPTKVATGNKTGTTAPTNAAPVKAAPVKGSEPIKGTAPAKGTTTVKQPVAKQPVQTTLRPAAGSRPAQKSAGYDAAKAPRPSDRIQQPKQVVQHKGPSYLDNKVTVRNISVARRNVTIIQNNTRINNIIVNRGRDFDGRYGRGFRDWERSRVGYYRDFGWRNYYHPWWNRGFYGGFYYPFRPCYDIHTYFYYPALYWMYVDVVEDSFYESWYADYYISHPVVAFPFVRVYYPTEEIRDLGIEVTAYPAEKQDNFRQAMINLTQSLAQQLANNLNASVTLGENEVVVTHYSNLADQGFSMEGYVDSNALNIHIGFKAFVDLVDPSRTLVFVPTSDQVADTGVLDMINNRIQSLGGNPFVADVETDVSMQ